MTIEERIEVLEQELARLKKPKADSPCPYTKASHNCKAYFDSVRKEEQRITALFACETITREAFRDKHIKQHRGRIMPSHYVKTEEDAAEYFALFQAFLGLYQHYLHDEQSNNLQEERNAS